MKAIPIRRRIPLAVVALVSALAGTSGAGCAGSLLDPSRFDPQGGDAGTTAPTIAPDAAPASTCPDIPTMLAATCGAAGCHDATTKAEALDLASPGVSSRLVGVPSVEGNGLLLNPGSPPSSVVYTKLLATPPFGMRMPSATGLDDATIQCVLAWVTAEASAKPGAPSGIDAGLPVDSGSVDAASPFATIRLAAGQTTAVTDAQGNTWIADADFTGGTATVQSPATPIAGTDTPALYNGQRYGNPSFDYQFPVPSGTYTVTLKFAEQYVTGPAMRLFDIAINGTAVETNFDIYAVAGAMNAAVDRSYTVVAPGGSIQITFTPGTIQSPKIDAIEIAAGAADGGP